jgi:hypothetical protein
MLMLQIKRINIERIHHVRAIANPHGRAVKVDQHPLMRIEVERVGVLYSIQVISELGTGESAASIGSVYMQPYVILSALNKNSQILIDLKSRIY